MVQSEAQSGAQSGAQSNALQRALAAQPLSLLELVAALSMKTKTGAFKRCLLELLEQALIEYTLPDKPNSRLQKYRLTPNGLTALQNFRTPAL